MTTTLRYDFPFWTLPFLLLAIPAAHAQHDLHRNATQAIAVDDLKYAARILERAAADDPETDFVSMMLALQQGDVALAEKLARRAVSKGLPPERLLANPGNLLDSLHKSDTFQRWAATFAQSKLLHGPMVGAVTGTGASFWVRTVEPCEVQVRIADRFVSDKITTDSQSDLTGVMRVGGLSPATLYDYEVLIDGQVVPTNNTRFRTFPQQGQQASFSVAFGGGAGYLPDKEYMWDTILARRPQALLMLGDNVYIDQPKHLLCQHYCYYRRQARREWRRLVASTPTFSIYDDHDFGTNDCVPGPKVDDPPWKRVVWNVFRQNWVNPSYGGGEQQPGCWFDFYIGDVHFIMLDGRYYRDLKGGSMLGPVQKQWLQRTLADSRGTFKVLASPVPWSEGVKPGSKDPWDGFPEEREQIFSFIKANRIDGVLLIAADRHRTDLRRTVRPNLYDLYELESSRLTNRHVHPVVKTPGLIWGYNDTCSFAQLRFDTTLSDPGVTFECISIDGEVIHRHDVALSGLRCP